MTEKEKTKVVVHSGDFHADDAFTVAALQLLFGESSIEVIRTRDEAVMAEADWVCDVGGVYDPETNRFDHHQSDSPVRDNGVPYAAFGLVWEHYGEKLCGSSDAAEIVDKRLIQYVDAVDNGSHNFVASPGHSELSTYSLNMLVKAFRPFWGEQGDSDEHFMRAVEFARGILEREIAQAKHDAVLQGIAQKACEEYSDGIPVFEQPISEHLFPEDAPFNVVVMPYDLSTGTWKAQTLLESPNAVETRAHFPESWAGLKDKALQTESKIADAVFCHNSLRVAFAKSKEGALSLATHAK